MASPSSSSPLLRSSLSSPALIPADEMHGLASPLKITVTTPLLSEKRQRPSIIITPPPSPRRSPAAKRRQWALRGASVVIVLFLLQQAVCYLLFPRRTDSWTLSEMETVFAFGDSYSVTGYDPQNGVLQMPAPNMTTTGGQNWLNYLTQSPSAHPLARSHLFDFACSGAPINDSLISVPAGISDFGDQVKRWKKAFGTPNLGRRATSERKEAEKRWTEWESEKSLFTIFLGINDLAFSVPYAEDILSSSLQSSIWDSYAHLIDVLYSQGARNFLFLTVPPMHRTPDVIYSSYGARQQKGEELMNAHLVEFFDSLAAKYPREGGWTSGIKPVLYSTKTFFDAVLDQPAKYGFKDATTWCPAYGETRGDPERNLAECGGPLKELVWTNGYHPTWTFHKLLAGDIVSSLRSLDRHSSRAIGLSRTPSTASTVSMTEQEEAAVTTTGARDSWRLVKKRASGRHFV